MVYENTKIEKAPASRRPYYSPVWATMTLLTHLF